MNAPQHSPMMAQYQRIKAGLPKDALLLFRLGDYYEMFFEDAVVGAKILNIAITRRKDIPMAGIPYHAKDSYIRVILKAGYKVAICEVVELEEGKPAKREVTQIINPPGCRRIPVPEDHARAIADVVDSISTCLKGYRSSRNHMRFFAKQHLEYRGSGTAWAGICLHNAIAQREQGNKWQFWANNIGAPSPFRR